mgnify:CR=1 FL=1
MQHSGHLVGGAAYPWGVPDAVTPRSENNSTPAASPGGTTRDTADLPPLSGLLDQVREGEGPGAAAPPTVYRALDFLVANGFIHKLQSVNAFVACHHPSTAQHSVPFLICNRCHNAVELEDRHVVSALDERARALGFEPQAQTLEVHGLCAACSRAA